MARRRAPVGPGEGEVFDALRPGAGADEAGARCIRRWNVGAWAKYPTTRHAVRVGRARANLAVAPDTQRGIGHHLALVMEAHQASEFSWPSEVHGRLVASAVRTYIARRA